MKIANCGHDENGGYVGGKAGDQTGTEWEIRDMYIPSYGWSYVFRWKNKSLAQIFANLNIEAANNNHIGYNQGKRNTFWNALRKCGHRPGNIDVDCDADCSSAICALIKAVGYLEANKTLQKFAGTYTGDMYNAIVSSGMWDKVDSAGQVGDILLTPGKHTTCVVSLDDSETTAQQKRRLQAAYKYDKKLAGSYTVSAGGSRLMLRSGAGTQYDIIERLSDASKVRCYGYYNTLGGVNWLYVVSDAGNTGYCSSQYLCKVGR